MSIWIPIAVSVVALAIFGLLIIGNKGSLPNFLDPDDWLPFAMAIVIAITWILYGVLR
jgi:hypothetical protein